MDDEDSVCSWRLRNLDILVQKISTLEISVLRKINFLWRCKFFNQIFEWETFCTKKFKINQIIILYCVPFVNFNRFYSRVFRSKMKEMIKSRKCNSPVCAFSTVAKTRHFNFKYSWGDTVACSFDIKNNVSILSFIWSGWIHYLEVFTRCISYFIINVSILTILRLFFVMS